MPTIAAAKPEAAPRPNAQRGPNLSATQPTIGAPIGVQPKAIASRIAMTRPRIMGSVDNCIRLLVEFVNVKADTPMMTSATPKNHALGAIAANVQPSPNIAAPTSSSAKRGFSRPAASSAPATVPTAITDVRNPYWLAPAGKTFTDMVEIKIWKLS